MLNPAVHDPDFTLYVGDALETLRALDDGCVDCCVTSPPYWGLRDYGTGSWEGGDADCDHAKPISPRRDASGGLGGGRDLGTRGEQPSSAGVLQQYGDVCGKCGARRVDRQLGLEATPDEYVAGMVAVFREVRRVLADTGTLWLNLGDSYAGNAVHVGRRDRDSLVNYDVVRGYLNDAETSRQVRPERGADRPMPPGLKQKDLVGIPWAVAQALRDPYYTGRIKDERDRIWLAAMVDAEGCVYIHKRKAGQPNGQGYDRKSDTYGSGMEISNTSLAIVERIAAITGRGSIATVEKDADSRRRQTLYRWTLRTNECREVLREVYPHLVAKQHEARLAIGCPSSGPQAEAAHVALKGLHRGSPTDIDFPAPASLFEPGWYLRSDVIWGKPNPMPESVTDRPTKAHEYVFLLSKQPRYWFDADAVREPNVSPEQAAHNVRYAKHYDLAVVDAGQNNSASIHSRGTANGRNVRSVWSIATEPYPDAHFATFPTELARRCILAGCPEGGTVLDPFLGSGTTALVARHHGRRSVGIELNPVYAELAAKRLQQLSLLAEEASL